MAEDRAPLVVAFVLTWNDTEMTRDCVRSVVENDYENMRVLLVDNGSEKPCGAEVAKDFPEVELITLPQNRGFTGGSNAGIQRAMELGADYIHLIGNDSVLEPDVIRKLVQELEQHPEAAVASPLLLDPGDEKIVQFYTGSIDRDVAWHDNHDFRMPVHSRDWPSVESPFVPFVAPMFRRKALDEAGIFDESFSTCWEDYDLLLRLLDRDWRVRTVGDAMAAHRGSQTTGTVSPYITYYHTRNRLICLFRYGRWTRILRRSLHILRTFVWQVAGYGVKNWKCHRAFFLAWVHFVFGVRGEGWREKHRPKPVS